ncbi:hypothetical protein SASPL_119364 [Salvia splendens]|uniref:G domain-containing protein n=1 Tax=Salvia splendens TaxID=180675 RepID=A0A8X8XTF6_SALSN|nr:uncharacterized protein LOC121742158 [Salvia splendens]KAG6417211.1 hypothetical protein SASPL_119364 [Salvia splendens]
MGGGSNCSSPSSTEDVSLSSQGFPHDSVHSSRDDECQSHKLGNSSIEEAAERQRLKVYTQVLRSYEDLQPKIDRLEEAKSRILSYTPPIDFRKSDVPYPIPLLVIGPKGSGKSSLINIISRVFEDDVFQPARAQVSCNSSPEDGTYFIHEYRIPRNSVCFSLFDTRGLSDDSSENLKMIEPWMTEGIRHRKMVVRESDSETFKARLKCMDWEESSSGQATPIAFVILVVNGLSVLESMDSADETKKGYSEIIKTTFKNPLLSFRDDKPAVVVTHGDLLSLSDRVRVRVYLGELLGVPPTDQIFDIPENDDPATTSAIFDLLFYSLNRADRCLPLIDEDLFTYKVNVVVKFLIMMIITAIFMFWMVAGLHPGRPGAPPSANDSLQHGPPQAPPFQVDWHKIRHLWLEE